MNLLMDLLLDKDWLSSLPNLHPTKYNEKIIPASYGNISHLPGSKMVDERDTMLGLNEVTLLTHRRKHPFDRVIITEKVDGVNTSVIRLDNQLYPLLRKGYDVRTNPNSWIKSFALFVSNNAKRYLNILEDGERLCGEWMIKTHTVKYRLTSEPYIVYDIIKLDGTRLTYEEFLYRIKSQEFTPAGLVHIGEAITPDIALQIMGEGYHGTLDQPEGVVYKYEYYDSGFAFSGKYVSHPHVGKEEYFLADDPIYNGVKKKFEVYIPIDLKEENKV